MKLKELICGDAFFSEENIPYLLISGMSCESYTVIDLFNFSMKTFSMDKEIKFLFNIREKLHEIERT